MAEQLLECGRRSVPHGLDEGVAPRRVSIYRRDRLRTKATGPRQRRSRLAGGDGSTRCGSALHRDPRKVRGITITASFAMSRSDELSRMDIGKRPSGAVPIRSESGCARTVSTATSKQAISAFLSSSPPPDDTRVPSFSCPQSPARCPCSLRPARCRPLIPKVLDLKFPDVGRVLGVRLRKDV